MPTTVAVSRSIFAMFPDFRRGIVLATGLKNSCPQSDLQKLLESAIERARQEQVELATDLGTLAWRRAHESFGSNPNRFPPSHIAMRKRVQSGKAIPFISPVVAVMNLCSLESHTSVGGDDLSKIGSSLELRYANGNEAFVPLGQETITECPLHGEVIYVDERNCVMCRRWNWRNSHISRIREETVSLVMNVDGLGDSCQTMVERTRDRVAEILTAYCNAKVATALLTPETPHVEIALPAS